MPTTDIQGRPYARLSQLRVGDLVIVDGDFDGCFIPWSKREVVNVEGYLALIHNAPECGACGGTPDEGDCPHTLDGQLDADTDALIGIYLAKDFVP